MSQAGTMHQVSRLYREFKIGSKCQKSPFFKLNGKKKKKRTNELAKECGITDVSVANYLLRTLIMLGLVYKSKEGRKTYYTFASTSEHDLDLACCGVLEYFNLTSTIKPLFSFDEWMQRYDTPIDQEGII